MSVSQETGLLPPEALTPIAKAVGDTCAVLESLKIAIASTQAAGRKEDAKKLQAVSKKIAEVAMAMEMTRLVR